MTEPNFHLRASEWKTSDQQRLEILMKVKNNEISQEEAVRLIEEMETNLQHLNTDTSASRSRSGSDASLSNSSKSNSPGFLKKFRISTKGSKHKSKQDKQQQQQERRLSSASGSSTSSRRSTFSFHFRRGGNKKQSRTSSQTSFSTSSVDLSPAPSGEDIHTCDSPDISNVDHDRIESNGSNPHPESTPVNPFTADSSDTDDEDEPVPTVVLDPDTTPGSPIDDTPDDMVQSNEEAQGENNSSFKAIVTQTPRLTIYDTKSLKVNEGDEVIVLDDSHPNEWLCQHNGQQGLIKFVYLRPLDT